MSLFEKRDKKRVAIEKEYIALLKKEEQFNQKALKAQSPHWKAELEKKVPEKVYHSLEVAFTKAFSVVFTKGVGVIEKTYNRENLEATYSFRTMLFRLKVVEGN